jgi:hypothetical protein
MGVGREPAAGAPPASRSGAERRRRCGGRGVPARAGASPRATPAAHDCRGGANRAAAGCWRGQVTTHRAPTIGAGRQDPDPTPPPTLTVSTPFLTLARMGPGRRGRQQRWGEAQGRMREGRRREWSGRPARGGAHTCPPARGRPPAHAGQASARRCLEGAVAPSAGCAGGGGRAARRHPSLFLAGGLDTTRGGRPAGARRARRPTAGGLAPPAGAAR